MKIKTHGIGLSIKKHNNSLFIEIHMIGKLTHEDYQTFIPILNKALKEAQKLQINMLVDMRKFKGWKLRAALDDMIFGLKYRNAFDKIAIVGNKKWEEISVKIFTPLMRGKVKFFKTYKKALIWLT